MKKILYLGYYDTAENAIEMRAFPPAAATKIKYICSAINRAGENVKIVSACRTQGRKNCKGHEFKLNDKTELKLFPCLGYGGAIKRFLRTMQMSIGLFLYLMKNAHRKQPVIVYHGLAYMGIAKLVKKIKGFRLILEIEEIYADVTGGKGLRKKELAFFKLADAYIFPTELLDEKINTEGKPSAIIYGTYSVEEKLADKFDDGKIHLLYAGTFDPRKGGVVAAAATAGELSNAYHVHICGFGTEEEIKNIKEQIAEVSKKEKATATYDGLLSGEEYLKFVQSCHVGLSTQNPDAEFNDTSFPSKVLSYLSNGLRVVSVRINSLEKSKINELLTYYDENTPKAIAKAIESIDFSKEYDSRKTVAELDARFIKEIKEILC